MPSYECRGKQKLWSVRFFIYENGKQVNKRISEYNGEKLKRKKDAELAYREFITEYEKKHHKNNYSNINEQYFNDVYEEYKKYKKENLKETSFYEMELTFKKHILPFFGKYKIKEISKNKVLEFQQSLCKYSYKYKTKIRTTLYSMYKYLFYYYDIDNVVARVEAFKKPNIKKEINIWNIDEFNSFIKTFDTTIDDEFKFKTFFTFLYYTGCRLGEVLAINYNDINFTNKTISINKTLSTKISSGGYKISTPKTASSYRTITIPQILLKQLNEYKNRFPDSVNSKFFFGIDKPLDDHTIYRRLEEHCQKSNVKKIRIHDFRHSHASLLIANGATIVLVSNRLGHTNTQQTLNTYAHLFPNSESELINLIDKIS